MKNQILIFTAVLLILSGLVWDTSATETRAFSMGQTGVFMYDNSNVLLFPGAVMRYGNEVVTELRLKDAENLFSAEVRLPINSIMIGLNYNRPIDMYDPGVGDYVELENTTDLYLGTKLMGNDVGLRLSYGQDGYKRDSVFIGQTKLEESASYMEIAAGISSTNLYDISIGLEMPKIKSEEGFPSGTPVKDEFSGTGFNLNGRYFYQYDPKMNFVPVARLGFGSASRKVNQGSTELGKVDYSMMQFSLGIGLNYQISTNSMLIVALNLYEYSKVEEKIKEGTKYVTTTNSIPRLFLGAEATIKSWLVGRIGANRAYQKITDKETPYQGETTETSYQSSEYNVSFGMGLKFGRFLIDLDINDGLFFEGTNIISGRFRDLSNRVSISYLFSNGERSEK
jgi:hypothetical protein